MVQLIQDGVRKDCFDRCFTRRNMDTFGKNEQICLAKCMDRMLKKNFLKKIFGYEARCEFWVKIGLRFWILVGYVDFLATFGAKLSFRV